VAALTAGLQRKLTLRGPKTPTSNIRSTLGPMRLWRAPKGGRYLWAVLPPPALCAALRATPLRNAGSCIRRTRAVEILLAPEAPLGRFGRCVGGLFLPSAGRDVSSFHLTYRNAFHAPRIPPRAFGKLLLNALGGAQPFAAHRVCCARDSAHDWNNGDSWDEKSPAEAGGGRLI